MKERDFQRHFGNWAKANFSSSAAFELKSARESYLSFSAVEPHQIQALENTKHAKLYMKIPDLGLQNPFDSFMLVAVPAYVVIRYPSGLFYGIDIDVFTAERDTSDRKSLTELRAKEISAFGG